MGPLLSWLCTLLFLADCPAEFRVEQVAGGFERSADQRRAVVLIPGLRPHFFSERNATRAQWQDWQRPGSRMVEALAKDADVFAFTYSQNVPVERIAGTFAFGGLIRRLKVMGYEEIVLVGHSAGGLIARQFVEDQPHAGVTRVIQVGTPNSGSSWARAERSVRGPQEVFLESLAKDRRRAFLAGRAGHAGHAIPEHVEFVCVMGLLRLDLETSLSASLRVGEVRFAVTVDKSGDGLVSAESQWPKDLQDQGVPVHAVQRDHFRLVHGRLATALISRLVREPQPRWTKEQVLEAREASRGP